jgi:hypothetical protein
MNFKTTFFTVWFLVFAFNKAFSATSATLLLKGSIAPSLEISITPETSAALLPLETAQTNLKVATLVERSNNHSGYKVTVASQNQGKLMNGTSFLVYTLTYGGQAVNFPSQDFTFPFTSAAPVSKDIRISYQAGTDLKSGDYTDTITFTIAVN